MLDFSFLFAAPWRPRVLCSFGAFWSHLGTIWTPFWLHLASFAPKAGPKPHQKRGSNAAGAPGSPQGRSARRLLSQLDSILAPNSTKSVKKCRKNVFCSWDPEKVEKNTGILKSRKNAPHHEKKRFSQEIPGGKRGSKNFPGASRRKMEVKKGFWRFAPKIVYFFFFPIFCRHVDKKL